MRALAPAPVSTKVDEALPVAEGPMARVTVFWVMPGALAVFLDGSPHDAVTGAVVGPGAVVADGDAAAVVAVVVAVEDALLLLLLQAVASKAPVPISADSCTSRFCTSRFPMAPPDPPGPSDPDHKYDNTSSGRPIQGGDSDTAPSGEGSRKSGEEAIRSAMDGKIVATRGKQGGAIGAQVDERGDRG